MVPWYYDKDGFLGDTAHVCRDWLCAICGQWHHCPMPLWFWEE